MAWRDQRNTLSNHLRDHMDDELIHLPGIEKGGNQFSPTHQPNILTFFQTQAFGKDMHVFTNDTHLRAGGFRQRAREHVILLPGVPFRPSKADRKIEGLPPQNTGGDGAIESAHAVVPLWARTIWPVNRPIWSCDEAI